MDPFRFLETIGLLFRYTGPFWNQSGTDPTLDLHIPDQFQNGPVNGPVRTDPVRSVPVQTLETLKENPDIKL